jgi:hypothetical protein
MQMGGRVLYNLVTIVHVIEKRFFQRSENMRRLAADEKTATVMVYTNNMLARGEVIAKENVRVSIWLRTEGVPNYIHLYKTQVVSLAGLAPKTSSFSEMFIPVAQVAVFHLAPPAQDSLDYDASEGNRVMQPLDVMIGSFIIKGKMRISAQSDVGTNLDILRALWLSFYEAEIVNPYLAQFNVHVPFLLVNTNLVSFGME